MKIIETIESLKKIFPDGFVFSASCRKDDMTIHNMGAAEKEDKKVLNEVGKIGD